MEGTEAPPVDARVVEARSLCVSFYFCLLLSVFVFPSAFPVSVSFSFSLSLSHFFVEMLPCKAAALFSFPIEAKLKIYIVEAQKHVC